MLIGVPADGGYNLLLTGVTGATAAPCPCRWLRREWRRLRGLCEQGRHAGGAKAAGSLLFARSAAEGRSLAKGGGGTAGGAPSGGSRLTTPSPGFCAVAAWADKRLECRAAKRRQKP